jgi:divalent metal cation (Fe/Co/Zn/Cd) transporter
MDTALPADQLQLIHQVLGQYDEAGIRYHALRTRRAAARRFVSMHVLVPGVWTVQRAHDLAEKIEDQIRERLPNTTITIHVEPVEDPRSWADAEIEPLRTGAETVSGAPDA